MGECRRHERASSPSFVPTPPPVGMFGGTREPAPRLEFRSASTNPVPLAGRRQQAPELILTGRTDTDGLTTREFLIMLRIGSIL